MYEAMFGGKVTSKAFPVKAEQEALSVQRWIAQ